MDNATLPVSQAAEARAREVLVAALRALDDHRMADNFERGVHPIIITSQAALNAMLAFAETEAASARKEEQERAAIELVPLRLVHRAARELIESYDDPDGPAFVKMAALRAALALPPVQGEPK